MQTTSDDLFVETQRFGQRGLWALILGVFALTAYASLGPIVEGMRSPEGVAKIEVAEAILSLGLVLGVVWLFFKARLRTRVSQRGLSLRFFPFHCRWQWVELDGLQSVEAVRYSPLLEYGGWGVRYGRTGKAYNVSGGHGARLTFADGRTLVIGSQDSEALAAAIGQSAGLDATASTEVTL